mgnify:CR=1 FL=1|jgi:cell division protein FtsB
MIKIMNSIISKIKEEKRNISMGIIGFVLAFIVGFGSYCIIGSIKILGNINTMHMLYVFSCIVIAYVAALIYSYKIIKLEKKYAFKEYKLNPHHKSDDSTQQDSNENSQSKDNQGEENKSVKLERNETEENAKNAETADTVAETAQVTEDVGKSDEIQQSSQKDK